MRFDSGSGKVPRRKVDHMEIATVLLVVVLVALIGVIALVLRGEKSRAESTGYISQLAQTAEKLTTSQAVIADRLSQSQTFMNERLSQSQTELNDQLAQSQKAMNERLDAVSKRVGDGLNDQTERTGQTLKALAERLAVIDTAQKNLTDLSQQVVGLQDILSNKQARGSFGEIQLENLVSDALPKNAYEIQSTLSNGKRVDCLIKLPNPPGSVCVDSKFPLEGYRALHDASDDVSRKAAARLFGADVLKHVKDIAERYIIASETADWALMFLPSDAVYGEIHANFINVVEEAHKRHVGIVSPNTMMATLQTIRAVLKDARMREQAGFIQVEVGKMMKDVGRLDDRVGKLQRHFEQAQEDVRNIRTLTEKIVRKGDVIAEAPLTESIPSEELAPLPPHVERLNS